MSRTVIRNTTFLTASSIAQKVLSFLYFTIIARLVGAANTGEYFFAISFTTIFTVVADFGLGNVLTREGAKRTGEISRLVSNVLSAKLLLGLFSYVLIIVVSYLFGYSVETRLLIAVSGITMLFDNIQTAFFSGLRALQRLEFESIGNVLSQIVTLIIGTSALVLHAPLYWLILAYTIPSGLMCVFACSMLKKTTALSIRLNAEYSSMRALFTLALPFALASIIGRIYSYADLIIMKSLLPADQIGHWSVAYKIVYAFQFIPIALSASLYPALSNLFTTNPGGIAKLYYRSLFYLALFIIPFSGALSIGAGPLVFTFFSAKYAGSIEVLRILALTLTFTYSSLITGALLNAINKQTFQTMLIGSALLINLVCNSVLIPRQGIVGAAYAALIASGFLCVTGLIVARRSIGVFSKTR